MAVAAERTQNTEQEQQMLIVGMGRKRSKTHSLNNSDEMRVVRRARDIRTWPRHPLAREATGTVPVGTN